MNSFIAGFFNEEKKLTLYSIVKILVYRMRKIGENYIIQYKFVNDFNLIVEKHIGYVQLDVLKDSIKLLSSKKEFSINANYLIDLRESGFSMNIDKVKEFVNFLDENYSGALENRIAMIADESDQVAMATLFKMLQPRTSRNVHVFSTLEYALLWLNVDLEERRMEQIIESANSLVKC